MRSGEVAAIIQTLLSCRTLFSDFFPIPNFVSFTSFEYSSSDGITVHEWKNGSEESKKKIKFNATGLDINKIQLQMVEKDGKIVLGGQVTTEERRNCMITGNVNEIGIQNDYCRGDICFYHMKDLIYRINNARSECTVFDVKGQELRQFYLPALVDCDSPFGFRPEDDVFVFMKDGQCKQVDYSVAETAPWAVNPCSRYEVDVVPNKFSKYYHLRYLLAITGCGANNTDDFGDLDNVYVRFLHENKSLITTTEPPPTTRFFVADEIDIREYLAVGLFTVCGCAVVGMVVLAIIYRKKIAEAWRKRKQGSDPKQPNSGQNAPQLGTPIAPTTNDKSQISTKENKSEEAKIDFDINLVMDENVNVDVELASLNPMDVLIEQKLKPGETFEDDEAGWTLPTIVNCIQPYKYCEFLGAGGFGRVYKYEVMSEQGFYVAVKFMKTDGKKEAVVKAKREFMLIRQIQKKFPSKDDYYLLRVVDAGKYPNYIFIVTPIYYRCMSIFQPGREGFSKSTTADHLSVAWHYLKGIQQLHSVGYGHNDIKPSNFMQKEKGSNTIILCDFEVVKKFGSKRTKYTGALEFVPLTGHRLEETSNVDDYQSWLFMITMMIKRSLVWAKEMKEGSEMEPAAVTDLFNKKEEFYKQLNANRNKNYKPEFKLICALSKAIITEHGPKNPVDPKEIISIMEEAQSTFKFKYATHEWCRYDQG